MLSNVTANFSLFLLSNTSSPAKGNATNGTIQKATSSGNEIATTKNRFELRNTYKLLSQRKIATQHASPHHETARHAPREKSSPPPRAEKRALIEIKHSSNSSIHFRANNQSPPTPGGALKDESTAPRHAAVKTTLPNLKSDIKILDELANSSLLPEELRTLTNDSNKIACRTEVVCKALEREGVKQSIHGNESSSSMDAQSPHSRQKRSWFGVDEKKLAAEMGPYVKNITAVLANKLEGSLVTVESMVENATDHVKATTDGFSTRVDNIEDMVQNATLHVITTTDGFAGRVYDIETMVRNATQHVMKTTNGFSGQVADIELMVKNATLHVMTTTDGFSGRVEGIEEMVRNATQHVISTTDGFSDDALEMKSMVKNATDGAQETSSYVREVLKESEKNFEYYIYFSGAFILVTGLISLFTAGCCQCRRSKNILELTVDKRKVPDHQKELIELAHELITRPANGHDIDYKITKKTTRYIIEIDSGDIVLQAILKDAFERLPAKEESPSVTSPLMEGDSSPLESIETRQTPGSRRHRKAGTPTPFKLETQVTLVSEDSLVGEKVTSL